MRPVMAEAAATEQADATATVAELAPKKWSKRPMEGAMIRTIKVDFDQSWALSKLVSHRMDQQRWAFNMAVKEKLDDPGTTKFDLNKMLTGWRHGKEWMEGGFYAQRSGLLLGRDAVEKFMVSNGKKRRNKSLWKYLATRYREREERKAAKLARNGAINEASGGNNRANLPSNKWSNKKNKWCLKDSLFKRKGEQRSCRSSRIPCQRATIW